MTVAASARELSVEVRKGHGWQRVVEPLAFDVHAGEIVGVVGESGAGKTLTTRALVGLLPRGVRASGSVTLGERTFDARAVAREVLGRDATVVLQNPTTSLDPLSRVHRTLVEGVTHLGLMTKREASHHARALLDRLGFPDQDRVLRLYPHELSGGMAQRVAIAAALMPSPKLLVVDEPTSALDAHVRVEVLELIGDLARDLGTGVALVSHDLALVGRFCDRVLVMNAGRILERGVTQDVLERPQHPYTQALLASAVTTDAVPRAALPAMAGS